MFHFAWRTYQKLMYIFCVYFVYFVCLMFYCFLFHYFYIVHFGIEYYIYICTCTYTGKLTIVCRQYLGELGIARQLVTYLV